MAILSEEEYAAKYQALKKAASKDTRPEVRAAHVSGKSFGLNPTNNVKRRSEAEYRKIILNYIVCNPATTMSPLSRTTGIDTAICRKYLEEFAEEGKIMVEDSTHYVKYSVPPVQLIA